MPLALKSEKKKKQFLHRFWKGSTRCVAYWLWGKPETLDVGSYKRNHKEKSSSIVVLCPLQRIVYDKVEKASSIGLTVVTVTDCRVEWQISTHICVSKERFGEAIFSVDEKKATSFHQSMPVCIKQIMACKPSSAVVSALSIV